MNHINYFKKDKTNSELELASLDTGFSRGNMFDCLYKPYRNYSLSKYTPKNEKERLMYDIQMLGFVVNDLVLYLDLHPTDQKALEFFNQYNDEYKDLKNQYERKYHPLCLNSDSLKATSWRWLKDWPTGGVK